jgi:hypothetical protein
MSTKTLRKRIALVAVSALGFGLVSAAPSSAAAADNNEVSAVVSTAATANTYAVGQAQTFTATVTTANTVESTDNVDIKAMITSSPNAATFTIDATGAAGVLGPDVDPSGNITVTTTLVTLIDSAHGLATGDKINVTGQTDTAVNVTNVAITVTDANTFTYPITGGTAANAAAADAGTRYAVNYTTTATDAARGVLSVTAKKGGLINATHTFGTFAFTPTVAGSYTMTMWHDQNADNVVSASEVTGSSTFVVTAAGLGTTEAGAGSGEATTATVTNTDTVGNDVLVSGLAVSFSNTPRVGQQASVATSATFFNNRATAGSYNMVTNKKIATIVYSLSKPAGSASALSASSQVIAAVGTAVAKDATDAASGSALTFTPDVAGTYTVTAWHDSNGNGLQDNKEAIGTKAIAVFADSADLTVKAFNSTADIGADEVGALIRIQVTNGGAKASLAANESVKITASGATGSRIETVATAAGSTAVDAATYTLSSSQFDADGYAWINVSATAAGTTVVQFEGQGGTATAINKTQSITFVDATAVPTTTAATVANTTGVRQVAALVEGTTSGDYKVDQLKSTAVGLKVASATASGKVRLLITDTNGRITGLAGAAYATSVTADATASTAFTVTLPTFGLVANALTVAGNSFVADLGTAGGQTITVTTEDAVAESVTIDQADASRALTASSVTLSGVVKDQFGVAKANHAVTISHTAGDRNATVATTNAVSDASGRVTRTWTDAPLTGVTATTDSIVFDPSGNNIAGTTNNKTAIITYVASLGVTKVVAYGGNTSSTGVTATLPSFNDIKAGGGAVTGGEGVETGAVTISAKVTDASGSVLVGVPVTWSIAGTGVEIATNGLTSYTASTGIATTTVYGWIKGTYTYTATAGGIASTGTISFAQTAAGEERTISATVSGSLVTAKVVDRLGNPVPLVKVWATKTGAGYFGNGVNKTDGTTDSNGEITFTIAGAGAEVTVATYDMSDATAKGSGQTCALAGNVTCSETAPVAFDATVAGTTLKGSTGVGASFAPAGVSSAKATVVADTSTTDAATAAADAAAEATDAANAATDAANAAAEAADAATAAAQDAADAVAALATSVSEMVDALKKQITSLTNLVIKIQKKVRA